MHPQFIYGSMPEEPTLSLVIPLVHCIKTQRNPKMMSWDMTLLQTCCIALSLNLWISDTFVLATIFDSRYKHVCYLGHTEKLWQKAFWKGPCKAMLQQRRVEMHFHLTNAPTTLSSVSHVFGELTLPSGISSHWVLVEEYLCTPVVPCSENPLIWWHCHIKGQYTALAIAAQLYLTSVTKVSSKRPFFCGPSLSARQEVLSA